MSSKVQYLAEKGLVRPPGFLPSNTHLEVLMGSQAYGTAQEESDFDIYGFCIPPKALLFPHQVAGEIEGFSTKGPRFEVWVQHHIHDADALGGKGREYDFQIFSIVKWFALTMSCNPNMVDALYTPANCVLHCTLLGQRVREKRRLFLHKGCFHKFKGYAHSQLGKMRGDRERPEGKRKDIVDEYGYDVKFAMHVVRLLAECEEILESGDLTLGRNREILKEIRRGEWTEEQVRQYFADKERGLEKLYQKSTLPYGPDETAIRALLMECLEEHFGSLSAIVPSGGDRASMALREIAAIVDRNREAL